MGDPGLWIAAIAVVIAALTAMRGYMAHPTWVPYSTVKDLQDQLKELRAQITHLTADNAALREEADRARIRHRECEEQLLFLNGEYMKLIRQGGARGD